VEIAEFASAARAALPARTDVVSSSTGIVTGADTPVSTVCSAQEETSQATFEVTTDDERLDVDVVPAEGAVAVLGYAVTRAVGHRPARDGRPCTTRTSAPVPRHRQSRTAHNAGWPCTRAPRGMTVRRGRTAGRREVTTRNVSHRGSAALQPVQSRWIRAVVAALGGLCSDTGFLSTSVGVRQSCRLRGRPLSSAATVWRSRAPTSRGHFPRGGTGAAVRWCPRCCPAVRASAGLRRRCPALWLARSAGGGSSAVESIRVVCDHSLTGVADT
jgi:hypothetical protein